jgi:hypothetical protein
MSWITAWVELPDGIDPDWSAAFAALDSLTDEECEAIVMEALQLEAEDLADAPPSYYRDKLRDSVVTSRAAWNGTAGACATLKTSTGQVLVVWQVIDDVEEEDPEEICAAVSLFSDSRLHEAAGFGSMSDHVVAGVRAADAQFIRRSCEKFKFENNESVLALADDIEEGKDRP